MKREGNTISAFRELAYIVVQDEELTDSGGTIPNFEFCVIASPPEVYVTSRPFPLRETDQLHFNAQPQAIQVRRLYQRSDNHDQAALSYQPQSITLKSLLLSHNNYHDTAALSYQPQSITLKSLLLSHDNYNDTAGLSYQPQSIILKQALLSHENYNDQAGLSYSVLGIKLT